MATKNRDGKPTEFQKQKLRDLGFTKRVKTYREAENAIKRLRKANKAKPCPKPCIRLRPTAAEAIRDTIGSKPNAKSKNQTRSRFGFVSISFLLPLLCVPRKESK